MIELRNTSLVVGQDIISRIEYVMVRDKIGGTPVPTSMKCKVSSTRQRNVRQQLRTRKASLSFHSDNNSNTLHTLVNGVTGHVKKMVVSALSLSHPGMLCLS